MRKTSNTITACAYMLGMSVESLNLILQNEDAIKQLEQENAKLKKQLEEEKYKLISQKQKIIEMLEKC